MPSEDWLPDQGDPAAVPGTFTQFVVKLHSRCNLNCPECYVYQLRDSTWADQPRVMSDAVLDTLATRIAEHARRHRLPEVRVMLHGGEPLLAGPRRITRFAGALRTALTGTGTVAELVVQTNGTLLDEDFLELFRRLRIRVGVSLDGGPSAQDRRRPYRGGRGSHADVARALNCWAASATAPCTAACCARSTWPTTRCAPTRRCSPTGRR